MKKVVLCFIAGVMTMACSKDDFEKNTTIPTKKNGDVTEYNYYESPSNTEEILSDFIETIETGATPSDKEIAESIWIIEGSLNFKNRHEAGVFDSYAFTETVYYTLEKSGNEVTGFNVKNAFTAIESAITDQMDATMTFHSVDVSADSVWSGGIRLQAIGAMGVGAFTPVSQIYSNDATNDRQQGKAVKCDGVTPMPNPGFEYAAILATNTFTINQAACAGYRYAVNVQNYASYGYSSPAYRIDPSYLFGQISAIYSHHQGGKPDYFCVSTSELNGYRDQIHSDISALMNPGEDFVAVNLDLSHSLCLNCNSSVWYYKSVMLGELKCTPFSL